MRGAFLIPLVLMAGVSGAEDRFMAPLPPDEAVRVTRNITYVRNLAFDLYRPAHAAGPVPVVVFLNGIGADWMRQHVQYTSWPRAVTARGLAGISMDSGESTVEADTRALVDHLRKNAATLGVVPDRIVFWMCSANVRKGLPLVLGGALPETQGAVVYYGTADLKSFPPDIPVLFARAGLDNPGLNDGLDALVALAVRENRPVELVNLPGAVHGFDLRDDDVATRQAIARTLDFMEAALKPEWRANLQAQAPLAEAAALVARGDWRAAAAAYEALTRTRPEDPILWQRLGEARLELKQPKDAAAAFEKALALGSPNRGMVSFAAASAYALLGDKDRAFTRLEGIGRQLRFFAERVANDPALASLRDDPRYAALLAAARAPQP
jgi:hypothetical protein